MSNLFAYGTLMCEDILEEVAGCRPAFMSGRLREFIRRKVKNEHYPAICPKEKGLVAGVVYLNVPAASWQRLDRFEGDMYERRSVEVEFDFGTVLPAQTYVIKPAYEDLLEAFDWSYETFLRIDKKSFRKHYRGYRSVGDGETP